ncbi:GNAT family N-acetyltransferase [Nocardioides sp.]|uniref:GNAT family N-acetyltransferase n=1 Tax=Nocardioides sp. TaxID=35761 RepID=UPI0037844942
MVLVRPVTATDLPAVAAIYDHEVRHGISTFATEPPGIDHWLPRLELTRPGDHLLVAERDGVTVGYAFSGDYRPRTAYQHTRETSIYLAPEARGAGVGRALYDALLPMLRADGIRLVVAVIAVPNPRSQGLHRACGFSHAGTLHQVGHKFGRWIDTELWELLLR